MKIVNLFLGMNYMSIKSVKFNLLLLPENRVLHPSVFLPAKQLSVLRPLSLKGFYETLRNYRNASRHCTLEHSSDNKNFSWGDQTILNHLLNGKNNLETVLNWTIKLLDCEVAMLLRFPLGRRVNFGPKKCAAHVQRTKTTKIYPRITFEY